MGKHAKLSASSAVKWLNCAGSVALEKSMPQQESEFAKEGTTAHKLGEIKIRYATNDISRAEYYKILETLAVEEDMQKYTDDYRDFVLEKYRKNLIYGDGYVLELEQRVNYSNYVPEGFGTADVVMITNGRIEIIDLKYGKGVKVEAENNPQLMLYALGALEEYDWLYDIKTITLSIFQPRIDNISVFEMTASELYAWGDSIKQKAEIAYSEKGECHAGEHCVKGFCRAMPKCRAFAEYVQEVKKYQGKKPSELTNDEIAEVIEKAEKLAKWAKGIKEYALQQALQGEEFAGYKVVEGRKSRVYSVSDDEVIAILSNAGYTDDIIYKKDLRTVADMEKKLQANFSDLLGEFVMTKRGAPTLAPLEDKRAAYNSAESDFKDII